MIEVKGYLRVPEYRLKNLYLAEHQFIIKKLAEWRISESQFLEFRMAPER